MWAVESLLALFIFIKLVEYYKKNRAFRQSELALLYSLEKYEAAKDYMKSSLESNPNSYFLNNETGYCLINLGKPKEAIPYLEKALENMPEGSNSALGNMALAYDTIGDDEKALYYCQRALAKNPEAALALVCKGNVLLRQNRPQEADSCFASALEMDGKFPSALWGKALCCTKLKDYEGAVNYHKKYCKLKPGKLSALNELANALFRKQSYEEVVEVFDKIIALDNNQLRAYCDKAHVLSCMGKFDEAMKCLNEVITLNPEYALTYYFQARIYSHLRLKDEAYENLTIAVGLNPELKQLAKGDVNLNNLKLFSRFYEIID